MLENYYGVVQGICDKNKIISELKNEAAKPVDFVFQPSVKIEDLPCPETRAQAAGIIARVRPEHVARINTRLDELFEEEIKKRMPWASEPLQQNLWSSWLLSNYFEVIQNICDEDKKNLVHGEKWLIILTVHHACLHLHPSALGVSHLWKCQRKLNSCP